MDTFQNKVALVTGAASGIGLGLARAFAAAGMKVAMADKRAANITAAAQALSREGARVLAIPLDVSDRAAWISAADRVEAELGSIDVLCSNAGVNFIGATQEATYEDWDFALGVNLGGAINAIHTVVPRMVARATGSGNNSFATARAGSHYVAAEQAAKTTLFAAGNSVGSRKNRQETIFSNQTRHVVITSSVSGLFTGGGSGVYATTKYALVGLAESLRADLKPHGIGVSVLCPGPVKSELFESTAAVRPQMLAATGSVPVVPPGTDRETTPIFVTAPSGDEVASQVLEGIRRNNLYIMTHAEMRPVLEARAAALLASLPSGPVDKARIDASARLLNTALYDEAVCKPK